MNDNESNNGEFMQWTIIHDIKLFKMTYKLKLNKIKQNDIEILYQIVSDMGNKIDELEQENKQLKDIINKSKCIIGSWSTKTSVENKFVYVLLVILGLCFHL